MTTSRSEQARSGAFVPLPAWRAFGVSGRDAEDLLSRISSNELAPLRRGACVTTLFLTPTGRIRHRVLLQALGGGLRAVAEEGSESFPAWVDAYTFAEDCRVVPEPGVAVAMLVGPRGLAAAPEGLGEPSAALVDAECGLALARRDLGPLPAVVVSGGANDVRALRERVALPELDEASFLQLRVELGVPAFGADMSDERFPAEAGLLSDVSFTKGCYTGQEVVARQDTYGKVTRRLVVVAFDGIPSAGDVLSSENKDGCIVTSVAPEGLRRPGGAIATLALAYVAARNAVPGALVTTASGLQGRVLPSGPDHGAR